MNKSPLLQVENLSVEYGRGAGLVRAVRNVSFELNEGETLAVVGESGSGKSTLALALLRLTPPRAGRVSSGRVLFNGEDLLSAPENILRRARGGAIGMVFQDPFSSLNPVLTIGGQIEEVLKEHRGTAARADTLDILRRVRLADPERLYASYPHQISGGQRQRALIGAAIAAGPRLLLADEPTTALDVTVQKEILDLLGDLRRERNMAMILITHNLGLAAERADRLAVMYAGGIVEMGRTADVIRSPRHPYTVGLLESLPKLSKGRGRLPVLEGRPPDLRALPAGCVFHPRCPKIFDPCRSQAPALLPVEQSRVACHLFHEPD